MIVAIDSTQLSYSNLGRVKALKSIYRLDVVITLEKIFLEHKTQPPKPSQKIKRQKVEREVKSNKQANAHWNHKNNRV